MNIFLDRNPNNKMIMNIGAEVYMEVDYKEALYMIENKLQIYDKKMQILNEQIIKNKAYLKLTIGIVERLKEEIQNELKK